VIWVRPEIVIRAELGGWTRDGIVRQAAFKGFDEGGKPPEQVVREKPVATAGAVDAVEAALPDADEPDPGDTGPMAGKPAKKAATKPANRTATKPANRTATKPAPAKPTTGRKAAGSSSKHEFAWEATPDELAALDAMTKDGVWEVGGFELKLTNLDKVIFPPRDDDAVTKRDLIRYFALIAPTMLPHLQERALNFQRFPNGPSAPGFWQKDIPGTAPSWLRRWREVGVEERAANDHLIADRVGALCWLGNQTSFEIHAWTSRIDDPMTPTFALIDIDPGTNTTWEQTVTLAKLYRTALGHLDVRGFPKTTGKRGIQVWIPIEPKYTFRDTSDWVEKLSRAVGSTVPELVSWEWAKKNRSGKARLDYTQNTYIKTLVAPYSVRPADGAPVSAPITWDELDDPDLRSDRWTIRTIVERVEQQGDLFAGAQADLQELPSI
jgi:bifunctional non-homologous end joining protein LigD